MFCYFYKSIWSDNPSNDLYTGLNLAFNVLFLITSYAYYYYKKSIEFLPFKISEMQTSIVLGYTPQYCKHCNSLFGVCDCVHACKLYVIILIIVDSAVSQHSQYSLLCLRIENGVQ